MSGSTTSLTPGLTHLPNPAKNSTLNRIRIPKVHNPTNEIFVRQYDIADLHTSLSLNQPNNQRNDAFKSTSSNNASMLRNPKLTGQIFFGGLIQAGGPVKVIEDKEMSVQPQVTFIQDDNVIANSYLRAFQRAVKDLDTV